MLILVVVAFTGNLLLSIALWKEGYLRNDLDIKPVTVFVFVICFWLYQKQLACRGGGLLFVNIVYLYIFWYGTKVEQTDKCTIGDIVDVEILSQSQCMFLTKLVLNYTLVYYCMGIIFFPVKQKITDIAI